MFASIDGCHVISLGICIGLATAINTSRARARR